jgi:hypothetical protein
MGKIVRAGAGARTFDKLEPELEPDKNGPDPQHWYTVHNDLLLSTTLLFAVLANFGRKYRTKNGLEVFLVVLYQKECITGPQAF